MGEAKDLSGQKFGRLTVLERAPNKMLPCGQHQIMWKCKCDCGNEVIVRGASLKNGATKSCGCYRGQKSREINTIDLTGIRMSDYGIKDSKLTVIKRAEDYIDPHGNIRYQWLCKCDCGNETIVLGTMLRSGRTKTCGHCGHSVIEGTKTRDLTGLQFGELTVIEQAEDGKTSDGYKKTRWKCKCSCGNDTIVDAHNLLIGHTKTCGHCGYDLVEGTRQIDLTGKKFGRLEVVERVGKAKWRCICECGNETIVGTGNLTSGGTQSCGCYLNERRSESHLVDLTGWVMKEHGVPDSRLTVIKRVENHIQPNGKTYPQYLCSCECGNLCVVNSDFLKTGHTKSCGCYAKDKTSEVSLKDITGQRFGKLTVIERAETHVSGSGQKKTMWRCKCDCGNEITTVAYGLISGKVISCGCLKSNGEYNVIQYLQLHNLQYEYQKRFDDLRGVGNKPLSFDFYIPSNNTLIECQGQQHYFPIEQFGGEEQFKQQQEHDRRKKEYAVNNGYNLLEISYKDYDKIDEILNKEFMEVA